MNIRINGSRNPSFLGISLDILRTTSSRRCIRYTSDDEEKFRSSSTCDTDEICAKVSEIGSVCMSCSFIALSSNIKATNGPCGKDNSLTGERCTSTTDCKGG